MKKIGIMSMQRVINYGSFLQAYGLKKTIESLGNYEVEFIDYEFEKTLIDEKKDNSFFKKVLKNINVINYIKKKMVIKAFIKKYNEECKTVLGVNNSKNYNKNIDELVIGSDEVFNCIQEYPVGYSRNLFGYGYEDIPVISYAGSFGYTTAKKLKEYNIDTEVGDMLKKFKAISVRDNNSFSIVKEITGKEANINLDPVLISNFDDEIIDNVKLKDYIIIYAYTGRLSKYEEKAIKKFAKKHNKKIVSLGFYQKIADYNLIINPFEVFAYFKHADYVITDTFHGSIFSIKTHTKFCTIVRSSNSNKLTDLMNRLHQSDRIIDSIEKIEDLYNKEANFEQSDETMKTERENSINYLKNNLVK